ncbi:class I SAM-dependent methyltransferase [Aporhodopirellula aestuarii]|uniref:Class I SAM-dependent methyltransferase n=1 Tax=Aporhodopirellula aestuarii TaxID=2950107 RepID=A0ABT0UDJ1_9BACT|nr:class I SAM-dependent methyltransferase [Aporhodopirellula aestuarii]MCM2375118.1 class I SAM-dependent methyltransferase [Aporhodopirellula aestuarii]
MKKQATQNSSKKERADQDNQGGMRTVDESIYDHPKYYDLVFGADVAAETKYILACEQAFGDGKSGWYFEPACGTGRLMFALRRRGLDVCGLDLNPKAVKFCNDRMKRKGYLESAICADMCDFSRDDFKGILPKSRKKTGPVAVAFNTINSFRHVGSEREARAHLECMADIVRPGGLYLLGLHLTPTSVPPSETESWSARRGHLAINTHMWTIDRDKKNRLERFGICFDVHTPSGSFRINDELRLRSYTPLQMRRLIAASGKWECVATHDFCYDIDDPIEVDSSTEDVIYVLQRK